MPVTNRSVLEIATGKKRKAKLKKTFPDCSIEIVEKNLKQ